MQTIMILVMAWNPLGFPVGNSFPNGEPLDAEYSRDHLLAVLMQLRTVASRGKLVLHADNVSVETAEQCRTYCIERAV
jgi:hypothetical protein